MDKLRGVTESIPIDTDELSLDFLQLPSELSSFILSFLSTRDLCRASRVCYHWKLLCEEPTQWKLRYLQSLWSLPTHHNYNISMHNNITQNTDDLHDDNVGITEKNNSDDDEYKEKYKETNWKERYKEKWIQMHNWSINKYKEYSFGSRKRVVDVHLYHDKYMAVIYDTETASERKVFKLKMYDLSNVSYPMTLQKDRSPAKISVRTVISSFIQTIHVDAYSIIFIKEDDVIRCLGVDKNTGILVPKYEITIYDIVSSLAHVEKNIEESVERMRFIQMTYKGEKMYCFTSDGVVRCWNIHTGMMLGSINTTLSSWCINRIEADDNILAVLVCSTKIYVYHFDDKNNSDKPRYVLFNEPYIEEKNKQEHEKKVVRHIINEMMICMMNEKRVLLTALHSGSIECFDLENKGSKIKTLMGHTSSVSDIISCDNKDAFLSTSEDGTVKLWNNMYIEERTFISLHNHLLSRTSNRSQIMSTHLLDHRLIALSHYGKVIHLSFYNIIS